MNRHALGFLVYCVLPALLGGGAALAQPATGSAGCAVLTQAAADGANSRIQADSRTIQQPTSVHALTCLDNVLNGVGLDVITNILNPATLLTAIKGQICNAITSTWASMTSGASCGLTINGFNLGIGGLGGGLSCPRLSFGGSGPPLATFGLGAGGAYGTGGGLYINGTGLSPTGYALPSVPVGTF